MNLAQIIERHAQFSPQQVAIHAADEDLTYPALWQRIERATGVLLAAGVQLASHERVAPAPFLELEVGARAEAGPGLGDAHLHAQRVVDVRLER